MRLNEIGEFGLIEELRRMTATGKDVEMVEKDCDRNKWFSAQETVDYGLADAILERMPAPGS